MDYKISVDSYELDIIRYGLCEILISMENCEEEFDDDLTPEDSERREVAVKMIEFIDKIRGESSIWNVTN